MTILDIPYVSQIDEGGKKFHNDCGAASGVMLVQAYTGDVNLTVDEFYDQTGQTKDEYLHAWQVMSVLKEYNISTEWRVGLSLDDMVELIEDKRPPIVLFNYKILVQEDIETHIPFTGFHFAVLVGVDYFFAYLNDPLWTGQGGKDFKIPLDVWMDAWTKFPKDKDGRPMNPSRGAIVPEYSVGSSAIPTIEIDPEKVKRMRVVYPKGMNIRRGPGTQHKIMGSRNHGEIITIIDTEADGDDLWGCMGHNRWVAIRHKGHTYMIEEFSGGTETPDEHDKGKVVSTEGLSVRSGPDASFPVIDVLLKDDIVKVFTRRKIGPDRWGRIGIDQWIALKEDGEDLVVLM
jgi:hypothetical protein